MSDEPIKEEQSKEFELIKREENAEFGRMLLDKAETQIKKNKVERVMSYIVEQTKLRDEAIQSITIATIQKEHYEAVLAAITAGQFTILHNGSLVMEDKKLTLGRFQPPESRIYGR